MNPPTPSTASAPETPGDPDPKGVPPPRRTMGNWRSLVLSLLVILAAILVWLAFVPRPASIRQPDVDVAAVARQAHRDDGVTLSVPDPGPQWRATSARWGRSQEGLPTWHAGYYRKSDDETYIAVQQTPGSAEPRAAESWLADAVAHGRPDGTVSVDGADWRKYTTSGDPVRRALVRSGSGRDLTTVVGGLATYDELVAFASTLRPYGS